MPRRRPRFAITVTTTVESGRTPRPLRSTAQTARRWSPSSREPSAATATTRSPSPSKARPASAPAATTAACSPPGWVDPHPLLMLRPSGASLMVATSAPRRLSTSGAVWDMAPLAQSTTRRIPSRAPGSTEAATASAQRSSITSGPAPPPVGPWVGRCCHSPWMTACVSSSSLCPPALNNFTPLSHQGLCEAETMAPAIPSIDAVQATAGVGTIPSDTTSRPPSEKPSARARTSPGPDSLVSRPIATRSEPNRPADARPSARTAASSSSVPARARTPSVPKRRSMVEGYGPGSTRSPRSFSACCTEGPCAPS